MQFGNTVSQLASALLLGASFALVALPGRAPAQADAESGGRSDRACVECHRFAPGAMHPVGVVAPAGSGLPLDAGGVMTCVTCHDRARLHDPNLAVTGEETLRLPRVKLCRRCHDAIEATGSRRRRSSHATWSMPAHLAGRVETPRDGLDETSRGCLGCHDDSAARSASHETRGAPLGSKSHPIGVRYDPSSDAGRRGFLRPAAALPPAVHLPQGTVGCTSCHSPYSRLESQLVVAGKGDRLCRTCHGF